MNGEKSTLSSALKALIESLDGTSFPEQKSCKAQQKSFFSVAQFSQEMEKKSIRFSFTIAFEFMHSIFMIIIMFMNFLSRILRSE